MGTVYTFGNSTDQSQHWLLSEIFAWRLHVCPSRRNSIVAVTNLLALHGSIEQLDYSADNRVHLWMYYTYWVRVLRVWVQVHIDASSKVVSTVATCPAEAPLTGPTATETSENWNSMMRMQNTHFRDQMLVPGQIKSVWGTTQQGQVQSLHATFA